MGGPPPRVVYAWVWRRAGGAAQWPDGVFTGSVLIPCEQSTGPGLESVTLMLMQTEELYNLYIIVISLDTRHSSYFTVLSPSSCLAHKVCPWRVQKALHDVKSPLVYSSALSTAIICISSISLSSSVPRTPISSNTWTAVEGLNLDCHVQTGQLPLDEFVPGTQIQPDSSEGGPDFSRQRTPPVDVPVV
eukprot:1187163-Prorocentrum_minimum.AAC.9